MKNFRPEALPEPPANSGAGWRRTLLDVLQTLVLSVLLFLGINTLTARIRVDSYSMEPTLYKGNFVIVNKLAYRFGDVGRGDIIVFHYPPNPQEQYIKRVIGLPGDQVHIAGGKVSINGQLLAEPYLHVTTQRSGDWNVPADALFVMGDNRNNSSDSRAWGFVPLDHLVGKALVIYWPPEQWGLLSFPYAAAAESGGN
jgi:signal peptidase I